MTDKIFVAGHQGLVGSAILRALTASARLDLLTAPKSALDLTDQTATYTWFRYHQPDVVVLCAAKVGGLLANLNYPGAFIGQNLQIQVNVLEAARRYGVRKLLMIGTACAYPRHAPQPIREEYLMTGPLEPATSWYATAKLAGIKMAQGYRLQYGLETVCVMPPNLYGPHDNFDLETGHVLAALLRKTHEAKRANARSVAVWGGAGLQRREFLHVDDLAAACVMLLDSDQPHELLNVGSGHDIAVRGLVEAIAAVVGYKGVIEYARTMPEGSASRLLDSSRMNALGWTPKIGLLDGIERTYEWYRYNEGDR